MQLGGVTRNAVIGKVHRLGLSGRAAPSKPSRGPREMSPRRVSTVRTPARRPPPPATVVPQAPAEGPGLVSNLVKLSAHVCKWPIGDPKGTGFTFCGAHAAGAYCVEHQAASVRPGTALRADRDPVLRRALAGLI
jgi:GcrA cell cycle regulator